MSPPGSRYSTTENSECSNTTHALEKHLKTNIMHQWEEKRGGVKNAQLKKNSKNKKLKKA